MNHDNQDIQFLGYISVPQQKPAEQDDNIQVLKVMGTPKVGAEEMQQKYQQQQQQQNDGGQVVQGQAEQDEQAAPLLLYPQQAKDDH